MRATTLFGTIRISHIYVLLAGQERREHEREQIICQTTVVGVQRGWSLHGHLDSRATVVGAPGQPLQSQQPATA